MSFSPNDSGIKLDASLEKQIHAASSQYEIAEILRDAAVAQNLVTRDHYSPDVLLPVDRPGTPTAFATTITVSGQKHIVEGKTEAEMNENLIAFYKQQLGDSAEPTAERPRDSESGRFVAARTDESDPVAKAELELKFKRGEISTDDYLAESGAIERHLEAQGVSVEALQQVTSDRTVAGWQQATQEFLNSPEGASWPGGEANKNLLGHVLIQMGADKAPNAENLRRAYQYLRDNNKLLPNEELEAQKAIGEATTPEELREAALRTQGRTSSSILFNR